MNYLKFVFNIRPELAHLGMPVWNMLYPFEGDISLTSTYNGKELWEMAVADKEDFTFAIDTELFSIFDAGDPSTHNPEYRGFTICYFKIAAQEKVEFENSCLYLSNEVFGVEDSSHLDSISISYQPDKNEAVYYQKVLMTPKAVANYLENAKHVDTNLPYRYISHDLYHSIVMDCSKETICKFVEDIYQPSFKWEKAKLLQRLERTHHRMSFSYDGFHR